MINLNLNITPRPKGRPRFSKMGDFVRAYTDSKTRSYEAELRKLIRQQYEGDVLEGKAYYLKIIFNLKRPKSVSEKKRFHPIVKPDIDNLVKSVMDAMNGIIYKDDNLICELSASKKYIPSSENQYTEPSIQISMTELMEW